MNMGERVVYKMASKHECRENRFGVSHTLLRDMTVIFCPHIPYILTDFGEFAQGRVDVPFSSS
jgi:hypothetical protein